MLSIFSANIFENKENVIAIAICSYFHLFLRTASIDYLSFITILIDNLTFTRPTSLYRSIDKLYPTSFLRSLYKAYPFTVWTEYNPWLHIKEYSWLYLLTCVYIFNNHAKLLFCSNEIDNNGNNIFCLIVNKFREIIVQSVILYFL